jgi:predicted nucleotidyltransferase
MRLNTKLIHRNALLEIIVRKIEKDYPTDVAVFICYGSFVTGGYSKASDIDFFFIPKADKGYDLSFQFIIDGIGYDLWPISWDRAKRIAEADEQIGSIIMDGKVLYYSSSRDLREFELLKKTIVKMLSNEKMVAGKVRGLLADVKATYVETDREMSDANIARVYSIVEKLLFALALLNRTYLRKGIKDIEREVKRLSTKPRGFFNDYSTVIQFKNRKIVRTTLLKMINDVCALAKANGDCGKKDTNPKDLVGFYEEFKSVYNKFYQACATRDYAQAMYASVLINRETDDTLKPHVRSRYFPELTTPVRRGSYQHAIRLCKKHERLLIELLRHHHIPIKIFPNTEAFREHMLETRPGRASIE